MKENNANIFKFKCPKKTPAPAATYEPRPKPNNGPSMHDLVIKDMEDRKQFGLDKYNTTLQAFNGRNAAMDAFQEALDLVVYFKQMLEEKEIIIEKLCDIRDEAKTTLTCYLAIGNDSLEDRLASIVDDSEKLLKLIGHE